MKCFCCGKPVINHKGLRNAWVECLDCATENFDVELDQVVDIIGKHAPHCRDHEAKSLANALIMWAKMNFGRV